MSRMVEAYECVAITSMTSLSGQESETVVQRFVNHLGNIIDLIETAH